MIEVRDAKSGGRGKLAAKWWTNDESGSTESKFEIVEIDQPGNDMRSRDSHTMEARSIQPFFRLYLSKADVSLSEHVNQ
jgi:hypothetical protein